MSDPDGALNGSGRLVQNLHVLARRGGFGWVLMAATGTRPLTLRGTGTDVWDFFQTPHTKPELFDWLAQRYRVAPAVVASDVAPALAELLDEGLLEWAS